MWIPFSNKIEASSSLCKSKLFTFKDAMTIPLRNANNLGLRTEQLGMFCGGAALLVTPLLLGTSTATPVVSISSIQQLLIIVGTS